MKRFLTAMTAIAILTGAAHTADDGVFALYRSSVAMPDARIHVATFDTGDGAAYNQDNCQIAASLFREQPGVKVLYWCEPGRAAKALKQ
jgi:hypothetical protein